MSSNIFCDNCPYCKDCTCKLYKTKLFHGSHHPNLMKCADCLTDNFRSLKCPICGKDIVISRDDFACIDVNCKLGKGVQAFIMHLQIILLDAVRIFNERC